MKPLDRALIAWSKGNFTGTFGSTYMTREYVFHEGVPVCARFYDMSGDPFILFMPDDDDQYRDNPVVPARHLKGRKWYTVMNGKYQSIRELLQEIKEAESRASSAKWRSMLSHNRIWDVGQAIMDLREIAAQETLDIFISSEQDDDQFLLGAKHLLRGRAGAVTLEKDEWGNSNLNSYTIHADFADALLKKMKDDRVTLHDLEAA